MATIYKRGKTWWIKYHLTGVRVQRSLHTADVRVAQAQKSQIAYRLVTSGLALASETPILGFLEDFCQYLQGIRTRKSYKNDISWLRTFVGPARAGTYVRLGPCGFSPFLTGLSGHALLHSELLQGAQAGLPARSTNRTEKTMQERWLSVDEIAAHLGVNPDTVYKWIVRKRLPAHKMGRLWKFKATEVDEWVRQGKAAEETRD